MKRVSILLLTAFALMIFPLIIYGADNKFIQNCEYEANSIKIICSNIAKGDALPDKSQFSLTLSGKELSIEEILPSANMSKSIYCLVDISGSMRSEQINQVKAVLSQIAQQLGANDNIAICALGDTVSKAVFLTDKTAINNSINALASQDVATNLYLGINEGISVLSSNPNVHNKKCLIVFSDGIDYQEAGITASEAENAVTNSKIPVYTVATLRQNANAQQIEYSKVLGSFARMSAGGRHFNPVVDKTNGQTVGQNIMSSLNNGFIIKADINESDFNMDTLLLRAVYTDSDGNKYEDTFNIYKEDIIIATETTTLDTNDSSEASTPDKAVFIGIALAAIAVIAIIILFIKKSGNKTDTAKEEITSDNNEPKLSEQPLMASEEINDINDINDISNKADYRLIFSVIGKSRLTKTIYLNVGKPVTIGKGAVNLVTPDDKIADKHCMINYENGKIYVKDLGSGEDTFVNGVPISQMGVVTLKNGELIRIGSYEYRIYGEML